MQYKHKMAARTYMYEAAICLYSITEIISVIKYNDAHGFCKVDVAFSDQNPALLINETASHSLMSIYCRAADIFWQYRKTEEVEDMQAMLLN